MDFTRPVEAVIPDAQGRILAVLSRTTGELNITTLAELSGVSLAHAARVVPRLVEFGMVERREAPPSVLVRIVPEHLAVRPLLALAGLRDALLEELDRSARRIRPAPANITLFGSVARGDGDAASDIDLVIVRAAGVTEDDPTWDRAVAAWVERIGRVTGNPVNRIEVGINEVPRLARSRAALWRAVRREGIVIFGRSLDDLARRSA
ncbi:MAG TPA: nucleotidyltransferase domain-containing protein [Acidimicrobiia bacterium]|nr:nucleotidyltransferase domain-containing protein [Acidimicrobiia bacterium]